MSLSNGLRLIDRQHQYQAIKGEWTRLLRDVSQDEANHLENVRTDRFEVCSLLKQQ